MSERPDLLKVHGALSALAHAVALEMEPVGVDVAVGWKNGLNLFVSVGVHKSRKQVVIDRLQRGCIHGPYDYRFSVSYSTSDDSDWQTVTGYVDLHHPRTEPRP